MGNSIGASDAKGVRESQQNFNFASKLVQSIHSHSPVTLLLFSNRLELEFSPQNKIVKFENCVALI